MRSSEIRKHHIASFAKLPLSERLSRAFAHGEFFVRFMDSKAREISRKLRRKGKRYFKA